MTGHDDQREITNSRQEAGTNAIRTTRLGLRWFTFLLGGVLVLAGLGYWGFGNRVALSQVSSDVTVFGPKTYIRTTGTPQSVLDSFAVSDNTADFTLVVQNGKEDGTQRVTSAVILLNDQLILGPADFKKKVDVIRQAVSLQAENTLSVEVRGDSGTFITISIVGVQLNTLPVADAGEDRTAHVGDKVELDGSGSSDADGDPLSFHWRFVTRPATSMATLSDPTAVGPTFTVDLPGDYTVELIVNDGQEDSAADTVTVSTVNSAPVADAGKDQSVALGETANLDGSGSSDVDGDPLTYCWTLDTKPTASTATLTNPTTSTPSLTVDHPGTYVIKLIVNDGTVDSEPDYVEVTTLNSKPVADAGPDQQAVVGALVTLDGDNSSDADGDPLTYTWALTTRPKDSTAALSPLDQSVTTLTPDKIGEYVAQLTVNDGEVDSDPDTAVIEAVAANQQPAITSTAVTTATVTQPYAYDVDATDPDAGDVLTYSLVTFPPGMTINAANGLIEWTPSQSGGANVTVRVTDPGGLFDEQDFTITVAEAPPANAAPEVDARADRTITLPTNSVALDGTVTDDGLPDPPQLTLTWSQDSGPGTVTFDNASAEDPTATFSAAGTYVLKLTASDGDKSTSDTVTVTVNPEEPLPPLPPDPKDVAPDVETGVIPFPYRFNFSKADRIKG